VLSAGQHCTSGKSELAVAGHRQGYLSTASLAQLSLGLAASSGNQARGRGGSEDCPWTVSVEQGQRINLSLIVLPGRYRNSLVVVVVHVVVAAGAAYKMLFAVLVVFAIVTAVAAMPSLSRPGSPEPRPRLRPT